VFARDGIGLGIGAVVPKVSFVDALAAKKAQGVKLGGLNAKGIAARDEAKARAEALRPIIDELKG
jgi:hypothetical protein